mgnify:CR=1 FL=1
MRYNRLGQSGLVVSELCLGAMTFGNRPSGFFQHDLDQQGSTALVRQAMEAELAGDLMPVGQRQLPDGAANEPCGAGQKQSHA